MIRQWTPSGTDEPLDQEIDLDGSWWAEVGPEARGFTWTLYDRWLIDQARVVATGTAETLEEARTAAVAAYDTDHSEHPDCTCPEDDTVRECPVHGRGW